MSRPAAAPSAEYAADVATGTLLLHAFQAFQRRLFAEYESRGDVDLRPKHGAVVANLDPAGTRPSELAARAGMTRPAMGELIDELEQLGYVTREPDPLDRRAKLVVPTAATLTRQALARKVVAEIEGDYRRILGAGDYRSLRGALLRLIAASGTGLEVAQPPGSVRGS
jgi:DNA-binding MarR family transcriptional regulator